jgi:hypothetical protein
VRWGLRIHVLWYVLANVAQIILWATLTSDRFFWPLYSIVAWGIVLAFHIRAARAYLPSHSAA